jgi:hypothetical protein
MRSTHSHVTRSEERLGDGIVPTGAFAAHAERDAHVCQQRLIRMAGVVASAIGVMHSSGLWTALGECHTQRALDQRLVS